MNLKKTLFYGIIPEMVLAAALVSSYAQTQQPPGIENKLLSINPICQRNIKMAGNKIQELMEEYPFAVRDRNDAYITGRGDDFKRAEARVQRMESELNTYVETINACRKPNGKK